MGQSRSSVTRQHEEKRRPGERSPGRNESAQLHAGKLLRIAGNGVGRGGQNEPREEHQDGDEVEQPFQDDRREHGHRVQALAPREEIGANHFAGPSW